MGLFSRNQKHGFDEADQLLTGVAPLPLGSVTCTARTLAGGLLKRTPTAGFELRVGEIAGWFEAAETLRFTEGTLSIHETWNGSPALLFVSTPASAPQDSAAGAALSGVPSDHVGVLHPAGDGTLSCLGTLSPEQLRQLRHWLRGFPAV